MKERKVQPGLQLGHSIKKGFCVVNWDLSPSAQASSMELTAQKRFLLTRRSKAEATRKETGFLIAGRMFPT